jgi:hypothetical protein
MIGSSYGETGSGIRKTYEANNQQATIWCTQLSALKIFDSSRLRGEKLARTESALSEFISPFGNN